MASIPVSDVHLHPPAPRARIFFTPYLDGREGGLGPSLWGREKGRGRLGSMFKGPQYGSDAWSRKPELAVSMPSDPGTQFSKGSLLLWRFLSLRHILGKTSPTPPRLSGPFKSSLSYGFMRSAGAATQRLCAGRSNHLRGRRDLAFRSGLVAN